MRWLSLLPRTLVARVFLLYSTAMLLFVGIGFSCFAVYTGQSSVEDAQEEAAVFISVITPTISESAVIGDYDTIQRSLERVVHHPALVQAAFIDPHGGHIEAARQELIKLPAPGWLRTLIAKQLPTAQAAIVVGGQDYGVLRLTIWSDEIAAEVWRQALAALLLSLLSLLGGVLLVWFPLKRWLGNLGRIQAFGQQLQTAGGQLSPVVDEDAPLEFRQTFEVLNRAADSLQIERQQASDTRAKSIKAMRALLESATARAGYSPSSAISTLSAGADDIEVLSALVAEMVLQLQRQTEQLSAIFRLSPDGFVSFDRERRVQYASEAFTRLTGIEASACQGWSEGELAAALQRHAASGASSAPALRFEALRQGNFQLELSAPTTRILELSLLEAAASAVSQVLHLRDITHEFEVDRLKSEFLTTAAHELRTPMTSIYGFTELMMTRSMAPERHKELLERVYRQSAAMMVILDELLDIARIEARRGKDFAYEVCELDDLVSEAVHDFTPPTGREAPQLTLAEQPLALNVDRMKLQQALRNLLSNAYKYSPEGGAVWVRVLAPGEAGMARIEVQDQGIGMKPQDLARVSERFFRADKSGAIPGTGLGMAIVKEIVELMGGRLEMQSDYGVGSTAALLMPVLNVLKPEDASAAANAAPRT